MVVPHLENRPACTECQRRKQKCSRKWPCQHCKKRNVVRKCHFQPSPSGGQEQQSSEQELLLNTNEAQDKWTTSVVRGSLHTHVRTFLGAEAMNKSTSENGDAGNSSGGRGQIPSGAQSQMHRNGVYRGGQDMSIPMHTMQRYVPPRWEHEVPHNQQSQHPHQQLHPDGSLASSYESSSTASISPHMYGDYLIVNGPARRIVSTDAYGPPGDSSIPATPPQTSSTAAGWPRSTFHDQQGGSTSAANMRSNSSSRWGDTTSSVKETRPKMLASPASSLPRKSQVQQSAAVATKFERAKTGDRTTHNDVERKYRTNLKDRIDKLRAAVPALQALQDGESDGATSHTVTKVSKGTVLRKATEYIQQLEQANRAMASEHGHVMERLQAVEAMLQNGSACVPQYSPNQGMTMFDPRGFN